MHRYKYAFNICLCGQIKVQITDLVKSTSNTKFEQLFFTDKIKVFVCTEISDFICSLQCLLLHS